MLNMPVNGQMTKVDITEPSLLKHLLLNWSQGSVLGQIYNFLHIILTKVTKFK